MPTIIKDNIIFNNVPSKKSGTGIQSTLTQLNAKNYSNSQSYVDSPDYFSLINAIDINWNGAQVDENVELNSTSDLLKWIKEYQIKNIQINGEIVNNDNGFINLGSYLSEHPSKGAKYISYGATTDNINKFVVGLSIDRNGHLTYGKEISIQKLAELVSNYLPQNSQINAFTVQFNNGEEVVSSMRGITGTYVIIPDNPHKDGYKFIGWNTDPNAEEGINVISNIGNEDVTYYAIWQKINGFIYFGETQPTADNLSSLTGVFFETASEKPNWTESNPAILSTTNRIDKCWMAIPLDWGDLNIYAQGSPFPSSYSDTDLDTEETLDNIIVDGVEYMIRQIALIGKIDYIIYY